MSQVLAPPVFPACNRFYMGFSYIIHIVYFYQVHQARHLLCPFAAFLGLEGKDSCNDG